MLAWVFDLHLMYIIISPWPTCSSEFFATGTSSCELDSHGKDFYLTFLENQGSVITNMQLHIASLADNNNVVVERLGTGGILDSFVLQRGASRVARVPKPLEVRQMKMILITLTYYFSSHSWSNSCILLFTKYNIANRLSVLVSWACHGITILIKLQNAALIP